MAPHKLERHFNNTRMMHSLPANMVKLVASGSASNESLNHEINAISKNQPVPRHLDSVAAQMQVFQQGKLLSHNAALYFPTTSAVPSADVLALRAAGLKISLPAWAAWCANNDATLSHRVRTSFSFVRRRLTVVAALREQGHPLRKPARKGKKRNSFNLVRKRRSSAHADK